MSGGGGGGGGGRCHGHRRCISSKHVGAARRVPYGCENNATLHTFLVLANEAQSAFSTAPLVLLRHDITLASVPYMRTHSASDNALLERWPAPGSIEPHGAARHASVAPTGALLRLPSSRTKGAGAAAQSPLRTPIGAASLRDPATLDPLRRRSRGRRAEAIGQHSFVDRKRDEEAEWDEPDVEDVETADVRERMVVRREVRKPQVV